MSKIIKTTGTAKAWTTNSWQNMDSVLSLIAQDKLDEAITTMTYVNHDMSDTEGWVEVGIAEITVTLYPREQLVAKELDSLKVQLDKVRAESQMRENAILDRISKLQAIEYINPRGNK